MRCGSRLFLLTVSHAYVYISSMTDIVMYMVNELCGLRAVL